ncbi:MAG: AlbA family DNA-binding domain-containing protein [Candidatus Cryosericum sp.]
MSTLLTKPMNEITYDDVTSFCDPMTGLSEGQTLEYKGGPALPSSRDIAKAASALANTFGGTLVLGVNENHQTGRPIDIPGVPAIRDLENQVSSILMDNINPPLVPLPEIRAIPFATNPDKAVVLVRVAQSNATPHAVRDGNGNELFYIRVHSQSRPEDWDIPASLERLQWLFDRRKRSEMLRDRIRDEALDRIELYYERGVFPHFLDSQRPHGQGVFWIVPLYPEGPVASVQSLYDGCAGSSANKDLRLQIIEPNRSDFPSYSWMTPTSIQDGIVGMTEMNDTTVRSFEFNMSGLLLYQETLAGRLSQPLGPATNPTIWALSFATLCQQLDSYLQLASLFYSTVEPVGLLQLHVRIMNLDGLCMCPPPSNMPFMTQLRSLVSYQRRIDCDHIVQANLLRDPSQRDSILLGLLCEIGDAFNWERRLVHEQAAHILGRNSSTSSESS